MKFYTYDRGNCEYWGVPYPQYWQDKELRAVFNRVMFHIHGKAHHMGMEWRIKNELDKRAACGGLDENGTLHMAEIRDRALFRIDLELLRDKRNQ